MLEGSPDQFLHKPIVQYLTDRDVSITLNKRVLELLYDTDDSGQLTLLYLCRLHLLPKL